MSTIVVSANVGKEGQVLSPADIEMLKQFLAKEIATLKLKVAIRQLLPYMVCNGEIFQHEKAIIRIVNESGIEHEVFLGFFKHSDKYFFGQPGEDQKPETLEQLFHLMLKTIGCNSSLMNSTFGIPPSTTEFQEWVSTMCA